MDSTGHTGGVYHLGFHWWWHYRGTTQLSKFLPSMFYLKAKDPARAAFTQGVVFRDSKTPFEWLLREAGRDLSEHFTIEEVTIEYFPCNSQSFFKE